jgi:DNA primase
MSVVDDVKSRLDIVETVSGYVALHKSGRYFKAPCPFHTEKTPSFIVNPERQGWHCFGACATGGDVFSFVMRMEGLDFGDTLRLLADKAGVALSQQRDSDKSDVLRRINRVAARFYRDVLASPQGRHARSYLEERGVDDEAASTFSLGLSPSGWEELKSHLVALGVPEGQAVEAGLLHRNEDGSSRDFFHGRLMFPIHNRRGEVEGFGARALDDSMPKYINTPKTSIFDKRSMLYGLHLASEAIRDEGTGIIVEGYMDVIAAHQHGYANVVASMGTAVTQQQVSQLKSLASSFVLALDPDAAGQEATVRSLESSWRVLGRQGSGVRHGSVGMLYQREPLTLRIAALPEGRDPDSLIRHDRSEWERLTREALPLMDFLIPAVAARLDTSTGQGKTQAVETLFPIIASTENDFDQERYFRLLADVIGVSEESLRASIGGLRKSLGARTGQRGRRDSDPQITASPLTANPEEVLEEYTLVLLLDSPDLKDSVPDAAPEYLHRSEYREIFTQWLSCSTIEDLRDSLDGSLHDELGRLLEKELVTAQAKERAAALAECLQRLERRHLRGLQQELLATDDASIPPERELERPVVDVNAAIKESFLPRAH